MVDERAQRLMAVEPYAVEIGRFALVPAGGRDKVDDRRRAAGVGRDGLEPNRSVGRSEGRPHHRAARGCVQPGEAPPLAQGGRDRRAVLGGHPTPWTSACAIALPGSQNAAAARRASETTATPVSTRTPPRPGATWRSRTRALPASSLDQRLGEPQEAEREEPGGDPRRPRATGRETAGDDQHFTGEERRGRQAGECAEGDPEHCAERRLRARDPSRRVGGRARIVAEQRRRSVEAERLRDRVRGDVQCHAGEGKRRAEPDAERDHTHVLEARVREQPLPRQVQPEERHRDRE